ncbi:MAG: alpha-L-fucosidase [Actinomycetaceae bacterium]|nr:alpha-L-fucosidase [Actinomycetaceae bacterium]
MGHPATQRLEKHAWFDEARFGLFVHFGLYSVAARHEWVMTRERTKIEDYEKYAQVFEPDLFDAPAIARLAKEAGMGYAVLTTKHHDGFCMWDTSLTDYSSFHHQGRDFVQEWVDALRAEGLRIGLYHSLLDWHHPDFTLDFHHPRRDDKDAREQDKGKDFGRYRQYLSGQVRELLTRYGQIDYVFFDFSYPWEVDGWMGKGEQDWGSRDLERMCRELQPNILINDRLDIPGDLVTPEQYQPSEPMKVDGQQVRWEACQTLNGTWGYHRDNLNFQSTESLVKLLADTVSKDGNLLLNIGPDGRGAIPERDHETITQIGKWMAKHDASIRGAHAATGFTAPPGTVLTQRGNRLYVHLLTWPFAHLHLPNLAGRVQFARFLNDGSEIFMTQFDPDVEALTTEPGGQPAGTLTLSIPAQAPPGPLPVIELLLNTTDQ